MVNPQLMGICTHVTNTWTKKTLKDYRKGTKHYLVVMAGNSIKINIASSQRYNIYSMWQWAIQHSLDVSGVGNVCINVNELTIIVMNTSQEYFFTDINALLAHWCARSMFWLTIDL